MTPELRERIANATREAHRKGVKANLIVLGRAEEHLLEGDDLATLNFQLCRYVIDERSKSRCDAYGQQSTDYSPPKAPPPKKYANPEDGKYLGLDIPPPSIHKPDIIRAGFIDKSYKNRYGWVEEYHYNRSTPKVKLALQSKGNNFKLFHPDNVEEPYYEGAIETPSALQDLIYKCAESQK